MMMREQNRYFTIVQMEERVVIIMSHDVNYSGPEIALSNQINQTLHRN